MTLIYGPSLWSVTVGELPLSQVLLNLVHTLLTLLLKILVKLQQANMRDPKYGTARLQATVQLACTELALVKA